MKLLTLILLLTSTSVIANLNADIELNLNGKIIAIEKTDLILEKKSTIHKDIYKVEYQLSSHISAEDLGVKSDDLVHFKVQVFNKNKTIANAEIITGYNEEATLETEDETGFFKMRFKASNNKDKLSELDELLRKARSVKIKE